MNKITKNLIIVGFLAAIFSFGKNTAFAMPNVSTGVPSATANSIIFNGSFISSGLQTTTNFEYATSIDVLNSGNGNGACQTTQPISQASGTLTCTLSTPTISNGVTYYFRAVASDATGTKIGLVSSIKTTGSVIVINNSQAPTVTTNSVYAGSNAINLSGSFVSNGAQTTTVFEYATSIDVLNSGNGNGACQVVQSLIQTSGSFNCILTSPTITPGVTYFFRALASNTSGTRTGAVLSAKINVATPPPIVYAPTISSFSPMTGYQGQNMTVNIYGNNFTNGMSVYFGGGIIVNTTNFVSISQVRANITIPSGIAVGSYPISVTNVNGTGNAPQYFTVTQDSSPVYYTPNITSLSPSTGYKGQNMTVNIYGTNFTNGMNVYFGGNIDVNSTDFISSSQVRANITIPSGMSAGSYTVSVSNTYGTSNTQYFTVNSNGNNSCNNGNPYINTITPDSIDRQSGTNYITIYGNNFSNSSVAEFNGSDRPTSYNNNGQLTMTVYSSDTSNTGNKSITVWNPNCGTSNSVNLYINNNNNNGYYNDRPSVNTLSATNSGNTITFNGSVNPNGTYTTAWFQYGTNSYLGNETVHMNEGSSNWTNNFNTTINLSSNTTYYYRAVANNSYGTEYGNTLSFSTNNYNNCGYYNCNNNYTTNNQTSSVATVIATEKTATSARLNGIAIAPNGYANQGYFEYGTTSLLGNTTPFRNIGSSSNAVSFSDAVLGLMPDTIYYFRAVSTNTNGTFYGNIFLFRTSKISFGSINEVVVDTAPSFGTIQSELLKITTRSNNISSGDDVEYTVTYKNNTANTFQNVRINVQLPTEITYDSSNFGSLDSNNAVILNLESVLPKQNGTIVIHSHVNNKIKNQSTIVTTATMTYNIDGSANEKSEIAYTTNNLIGGNGLSAASIFGDGSFLPKTLIGWLLLIIFVLGMIVLIRKIYMDGQKSKGTVSNLPH